MNLLDLIAKHESNDNYNIVYGGDVYPLTSMTVDEVLDFQRGLISNTGFSASGRYQIIRKTLFFIKSQMSLSGDELFDEKMQDKMAIHLLNGRGFNSFLSGKKNIYDMALDLSKEWASFPKDKSNLSYYHSDGVNKALIDYEDVIQALEYELSKPKVFSLSKGKPTLWGRIKLWWGKLGEK